MNETFKTIAKFQYSSEAQIIKGRLEADGIQVFLSDNLTIDTDPLISNAIGGVKLKVLASQEKEAKNILQTIKKYSVDDDGNQMECPNCNSKKIQLFSTITSLKSFFAFLIGLLFGTLPFHTRYKYKCDQCKTEFNTE